MNNKQPKILVIGDSCNDIFIYGECNRLCPDAPVPVFNPISERTTLGMAGNVYENLKGLGAIVHFITQKEEINKIRYVHERTNQMFIRVDTGEKQIKKLQSERLKLINWDEYDAVVISDYDKGFLSIDMINNISKKHPLTFIDTKKILGNWINNYSYIKINEVEFSKSYSIGTDIEGNPFNGQDVWIPKTIITKGSKGAEHNKQNFPVQPVEIKDTTGAGDTFLASLVYYYCLYKNEPNKCEITDVSYEPLINEAIRFANCMSTMAVQEKGTSIAKKEWKENYWNDLGSW